MLTRNGHLTYCSNIHAGESWPDHFEKLKENIPAIKKSIAPEKAFGIGLRLSNVASLELEKESSLNEFKDWLQQNDCYVFTMNGFPYGGFHHTRVKDQVHAPDWTTTDRVSYTKRLADILSKLLPEGLDGGISTSPLSYRFWHKAADVEQVLQTSTFHILEIVEHLIGIRNSTGKHIHIDIEPEPDGLLGESKEFFNWYTQYLLPIGAVYFKEKLGLKSDESTDVIKDYIQICYDICHFAVCFEEHAAAINQLKSLGIKTGKIQISAALKAALPDELQERKAVINAFRKFNEPVYLHQVVALKKDGELIRYPDMPEALEESERTDVTAWRSHYHVPLFIDSYGLLESTQQDIVEVLKIHQESPFTNHLEIETYTWEVLPEEMRLPIAASIIREMQWVLDILKG